MTLIICQINIIKGSNPIIDKLKSNSQIIIKQLRVYQWSKNLLLFVPALASHNILSSNVFINSLISFCSFSLLASSVYIFNDLMDINYDCKHPMKKNRPISNKDMSRFNAVGLLSICLVTGLGIAYKLNFLFFLISGVYIILNILYSCIFKKIIIVDFILLMIFYTLRLIAGHMPNQIPFSPWLLSFFIFLFFSLGLLKRYIDIRLIMKEDNSNTNILIYNIDDSNILIPLGLGSGLISALVIILYTSSEQVQQYYSNPIVLICLAPLILYWISKIWLLAARGEIKEDPILFVAKDITSYLLLFFVLVLIIIAI